MTPLWKRVLFRLLAVLLGVGIPYLAAEGLYALGHGSRAGTSLANQLYARWFTEPDVPAYDPHDPTTWVITDPASLAAMIELFKANGVGIGNSPFRELRRDAVAINTKEHGCLVQKPNLRKTMAFLRSNAFNPFDPPTYFYDAERTLPPELARFFERYGFRRVLLTTNADGERVTVPAVAASDVVLVAGDSVANGAMLDDADTIASRLQHDDGARQYVNLGIAGAGAADIKCALDRAAQRYAGRVRELIYVFCENDFKEATASDVVPWLVAFKARERIDRVVLLYVPYIYNVLPEVTRVRGHTQFNFPTFRDKKRDLLRAARDAGFPTVDYVDITTAAQQAQGTQFAALGLYLDHAHPSVAGVDRLVAAYRQLGK